MRRRHGYLLAATLVVSACGQDERVCTTLYAYGLTVQVQDSLTGAVLADGVTVTAQDGGWTETLQTHDGQTFSGAGERAGTYTVRAQKTGYAPWEKANVVVTADECHVQGVALTAKLQPAP